jgi:predicted deacylase
MTRDDLRATFDRLAAAGLHGVPGVIAIDSLAPGPVAGITACTHGNEPAGLAAIGALLAMYDAGWRPALGRLLLVVNNLAAAARWFAAADDAARLAARFVDTDMNRLPADVLSRTEADSEGTRARSLAPVWAMLDAALDIHTTQQPSAPMLVEGAADCSDLAAGMPIGIVIRDIVAMQIGVPAFGLYRGRAFEIEAGSHDDPAAWALAAACARIFLGNLGMLPRTAAATPPRDIYRVCGALRLPDARYELERVFPTFHPVRRGEVIARGPGPGGAGLGPDLCAPTDGHVIFAPAATRPPSLANETLFFTRPVERQ